MCFLDDFQNLSPLFPSLSVASLFTCVCREKDFLCIFSFCFLDRVVVWGGRRSILTRGGRNQHKEKKEVVKIVVTFISYVILNHACFLDRVVV